LDRLTELRAGLVLASSKTAVEIRPLQSAMDSATGIGIWPAIVENGAGILWPDEQQVTTSETYQNLCAALKALPAKFIGFRGFGDMTVQEIAERTGLPLEQAELAKQRQFSEPGVWQGTSQGLAAFQTALAEHGIHARRGGRFLTLSFGQTKADAMARVIEVLQPQTTIALGDAPNDIEMIEAAERGVVIHNPHAKPLPPLRGEATGTIIRSAQPGPAGWADAILQLTAGRDEPKDQ
jgi:mannosyl-3-phosphoglycerate phosphatase